MRLIAILLIAIGVYIIWMSRKHSEAPQLVGSYEKDDAPMKTYTIIDSEGNKSSIITNKPMNELIKELNNLAYKYEDKETIREMFKEDTFTPQDPR